MTDYARIIITGRSPETIREAIARAKEWGPGLPVYVSADTGFDKLEEIESIEQVLERGQLAEYIEENFRTKGKVLKYGGCHELYMVPDPDIFTLDGKFTKIRHRPTNITPKKKKRRKR
jgi:hypothetical protein